ncbi:hypothetical protein AMTRI_Chr13g116880 [Amborella trichopoda]
MSFSLGKLRAFSLGNLYSSIYLGFSREALLFCFPPFIWRESSRKGRQFNKAEMEAIAMTSTQLDDSALIPNLSLKTAISNSCN